MNNLDTKKQSGFKIDIILTAAGQIGVMLIALLINKVVSGYLQPSDFTIFSIANRAASIIAFIILMGLGIAIPRYIAQARAKNDTVHEQNLLISAILIMVFSSLFVSGIALIFDDLFSKMLFGSSEYSALIGPMLLFALGISLSTFLYSHLRGVDKFKEYNALQVILQLINLLIVLGAGASIALQLASRGLIISGLSSILIILVITILYKKTELSKHEIKKSTKELLSYCIPRVPGEVFLFSFTVIPMVIISSRFGFYEAAGFATAITLLSLVAPFFQFIGTVLLPYVSRQIVHGNFDDIRDKITKLRILYLTIGAFSVIVMLLAPEMLIRILFNDSYAEFAQIVKIIFISTIPYGLYLLLRNPLDAISKKPFNTINLGVSLGILITLVSIVPTTELGAAAFPLSYFILGVLSEFTWSFQLNKKSPRRQDKG